MKSNFKLFGSRPRQLFAQQPRVDKFKGLHDRERAELIIY